MTAKKLILGVLPLGAVALLSSGVVYAEGTCESNYGGGETCIINKSFRIEKKVATVSDDKSCKDIDSDKFKDKVTDVEKGDELCFRVRVKNTGQLTADDMKMKDNLPDELVKLGGSGLTEVWENFLPGKTKEFFIRVKVDDDEFDKEDFDKCVVNRAEVTWKGKFEGSSVAVVCYGDETKIKELPKTGFDTMSLMTALGTVSTGVGLFIKKAAKKAKFTK